MNIAELDFIVKQVCPIHGINSDGVIFFKEEATEEQRYLATEVVSENLPKLLD